MQKIRPTLLDQLTRRLKILFAQLLRMHLGSTRRPHHEKGELVAKKTIQQQLAQSKVLLPKDFSPQVNNEKGTHHREALSR